MTVVTIRPLESSIDIRTRAASLLLAFLAAFSAGCSSFYPPDVHVTTVPRPPAVDMKALACQPILAFGVVAPSSIQGLGPTISFALVSVLLSGSPPIWVVPTTEMVNRLGDEGLVGEYADMVSGFARSGILPREQLRRIGGAFGSRYALLPGLAEFGQTLADKFEFEGIKLVRTRVSTLRLWLQLWDTQTGHILWQSTGEVTLASHIARAQESVSLDELARILWSRMIADELIGKNSTWRCP